MIGDKIKLSLPARAEYILTIRMAVSSIATRLDFDIDVLEDLKAGAAEACILFLSLPKVPERFDITISIDSDFSFDVRGVGSRKHQPTIENREEVETIARCLIEEFYDKFDFTYEDDELLEVLLTKSIEG